MDPVLEGHWRYESGDVFVDSWIGVGMEWFLLGPEVDFDTRNASRIFTETVTLEDIFGRVALGLRAGMRRWSGVLEYGGWFSDETLHNAISARVSYAL